MSSLSAGRPVSSRPSTPGADLRRKVAGGGTYGEQKQIAYASLRAAGFTSEAAATEVAIADLYFKKLGVSDSTPTRIPGNRRKS
jgi:hypothetical protein